MTTSRKIITISILAVLLFAVVLPLSAVFAEKTTDVLYDLQSDITFNPEDYPSISLEEMMATNKPLLEVIQIAESESKKLYIYTYQPTNGNLDLQATSISISCEYSSNGEGISPTAYKLELVSTNGVFNKYVVKEFEVSEDAYRWYNIVTIWREFNPTIDEKIAGTDTVEKALSVGQQWCAYYLNDKLIYEMGRFETLEIKVTFTGNFEFSSGITIGNLLGSFQSGNSWFVAFNCEEYIIKHIYEAELSYAIRDASIVYGPGASGEWSYGEFTTKRVLLTDKDTVTYDGGGLWSKEYTWNRISKAEDFILNAQNQEINISEECKTKLAESQWVFAFVETEKDMYASYGSTVYFQSDIDDVTILRIHFLDINNKIYDLGVVADRVNPDNNSDGYGGMQTPEDSLRQALIEIYTAMLIFVIVLLVIVLVPPILKWILRL